jgi:hypothetical protein
MLKHFELRLGVEAASGHSIRVAARTTYENGGPQMIAIAPHPDRVLPGGRPDLTSLIAKKVQNAWGHRSSSGCEKATSPSLIARTPSRGAATFSTSCSTWCQV